MTREEVLEEYSNDYKISEAEVKSINLKEIFDRLNRKYFDEDMEEYLNELEWSTRLIGAAGNCYKKSGKIRMSVDYHRKYPEQIDRTLCHEMIHLKHKGHGDGFKSEMNRINEIAGQEFVRQFSDERAKVNYVCYCPECGRVLLKRSLLKESMKNLVHNVCETDLEWIEVD